MELSQARLPSKRNEKHHGLFGGEVAVRIKIAGVNAKLSDINKPLINQGCCHRSDQMLLIKGTSQVRKTPLRAARLPSKPSFRAVRIPTERFEVSL